MYSLLPIVRVIHDNDRKFISWCFTNNSVFHFFLIQFDRFAARQFTVRLGDIDLSTDREPSAPVTFKVTDVRAHPRFSRVGFYNDIAVLVLDRPVRKSKYVIPVCLPKPGLIPAKERLPGKSFAILKLKRVLFK